MILPVVLVSNYAEINENLQKEEYLRQDIRKEYVIKRLFINPEDIKIAIELIIHESPLQPVFEIFVEGDNGSIELFNVAGPEVEELLINLFGDE